MKKLRLSIVGGVTAAVLAGVLFTPLPFHVTCRLQLEPRDATAVYVEVPGELREIHARPGDQLAAGQPLLSLDSEDVRLELARLEAERRAQQTRLTSLRQQSFRDEAAHRQLKQVQETIAGLADQIAQRERDAERLLIRAPLAGVIFPPAPVPASPREASLLPTWHGTPFDNRNRHAFLRDGTLVCRIGDPRRLTALLAIDQADIEFVAAGQQADIFPESLHGDRLAGRIEHLSQRQMTHAPANLSAKSGGDLATTTDATGRERPRDTTYQAAVPLDLADATLLVGGTGRAKIHAGYQSLARRLWRTVCHTFRFDL